MQEERGQENDPQMGDPRPTECGLRAVHPKKKEGAKVPDAQRQAPGKEDLVDLQLAVLPEYQAAQNDVRHRGEQRDQEEVFHPPVKREKMRAVDFPPKPMFTLRAFRMGIWRAVRGT